MRGVFAKKDFKKGDTLIFVPNKLCLTTRKILEETTIGKQISDLNLLDKLYHPLLAIFSIFYLTERDNKDSFFFKFFQSFPDTENFPIFFNEEELYALKGSPFLDVIREDFNDQVHDYQIIASTLEGFKDNFT